MSFEYLIGKRATIIEYEVVDDDHDDNDDDDDDNDNDIVYEDGTREADRYQGLILDVKYLPNPDISPDSKNDALICVTLLLEGDEAGEVYAWEINKFHALILSEDDYNVVKNKLINKVKEREVTRAELLDIETE